MIAMQKYIFLQLRFSQGIKALLNHISDLTVRCGESTVLPPLIDCRNYVTVLLGELQIAFAMRRSSQTIKELVDMEAANN